MLNLKPKHMSKYITSLILVMLTTVSAYSQEDNTTENDSITYQQKYGLRLGVDLSKVVMTLIDEDYTGFEINGDYRIKKNLYIAAEIGTEEKTTTTDYLNITAQGSYLKAGIDYNMYKNWFGMENMIYSGFRGGFSTFKQTLNSYTIYDTNNQTWGQTINTDATEYDGLNAIWAELILGMKVEVLNNLYIGANVQLKGRISETEPDNLENLYIPGFGRTYDSGSFGIGFGYNISYLIPLYKKDK